MTRRRTATASFVLATLVAIVALLLMTPDPIQNGQARAAPVAYEYDVLPGIQRVNTATGTLDQIDLTLTCGWHSASGCGLGGTPRSIDISRVAGQPVYAAIRAATVRSGVSARVFSIEDDAHAATLQPGASTCYRSAIVAHEYIHALEDSLHPGCYTGTCWWGDAPREDALPNWLQNLYPAPTGAYGTAFENLTEGWAIEGVAMYFQFRYGRFLHGLSGDGCDFGRQRLDDIYQSGRDHGPHRLGHGLVCELLHITGVPPATLLAAGTFEELFGLTPDDFYEQVRERIEARIEARAP